MEQILYRFDEGTPFQEFIDNYREKIVGHILKACYLSHSMFVKATVSDPIYLILDDVCFGIDYLYQSHVSILTADEEGLH